jgi:TetR/AcrR family transcriptional regulator, multidrug resistance operon repressor
MNVHLGDHPTMTAVTDKKTAIFESTLTLVRENGFHGTPMSQIAKKAGVAAGTIYHHFDSKDTLILELYEHVVGQMLSSLLQADAEEMDFKERFFNFFVSHCLFYIEHPNALFFMEQFVNSPYNNRQTLQENERAQGTFRHLIQHGVKNHLLKPLDYRIIGSLVHGAVVSAAKMHLCRKIALSREELGTIAGIMWDGIKKPAAA